jgi:hypothetical protein
MNTVHSDYVNNQMRGWISPEWIGGLDSLVFGNIEMALYTSGIGLAPAWEVFICIPNCTLFPMLLLWRLTVVHYIGIRVPFGMHFAIKSVQ